MLGIFKTNPAFAFIAGLALISAACAPSSSAIPKADPKAKQDVSGDAAYRQRVAELTALDRKAEALFRNHKADEAASLIEQGEVLAKQLLGVPRPTLEATEAASDLDELYGRMLMSNRHYGWARMQFQKNLARWRHWEPHTPETELREKRAQDAIAECDRLL